MTEERQVRWASPRAIKEFNEVFERNVANGKWSHDEKVDRWVFYKNEQIKNGRWKTSARVWDNPFEKRN